MRIPFIITLGLALATTATAQTPERSIEAGYSIRGMPDKDAVGPRFTPPNFYLYNLYKDKAERLVFHGQSKEGAQFKEYFLRQDLEKPLAIVARSGDVIATAKKLGLTKLDSAKRVSLAGGASFSMVPAEFNTTKDKCQKPYQAVLRIVRQDRKIEELMFFKKWPSAAKTIAYCRLDEKPADVTYEYDNFDPVIFHLTPAHVFLKLPGQPVLIRYGSDGTTTFGRGQNGIVVVPARELLDAWRNVYDNGPKQQEAIRNAEVIIRKYAARQLSAR